MIRYAGLIKRVERRIAEIHDSLRNGLEVIEIEDLSENEALTLKNYLESQNYSVKYRAVLPRKARGKGSYVLHVLGGKR